MQIEVLEDLYEKQIFNEQFKQWKLGMNIYR